MKTPLLLPDLFAGHEFAWLRSRERAHRLATAATRLAGRTVVLIGVLLQLVLTWNAHSQVDEFHNFTGLNRAVPDGNPSGLSVVTNLSSSITNLTALRVKLHVASDYSGDLYGYLRHIQGTTTNFCVLLNRVGRTAIVPEGYADAGLDVTFDDAAVNGDIHVYASVTNLPAGTTLTNIWRPDGRNVDPDLVLDSSSRTTTLASFAGVDASGEWTLFLADMASGGTNMLVSWGLEFTGKATPTITWPTPANITYGTALSGTQLNAAATFNALPVAGTYVYTNSVGTVLTAGSMLGVGNGQSLFVTFTPDDSASYFPVTASVSINVLPAPLDITASNDSKTYGGTKSYGAGSTAFTTGPGQLQNGETVGSVTITAGGGTAAGDAVGGYTLTPSGATGGTFTPGNYSITYHAGTLTVNALPVVLAGSRGYDGTTVAAFGILTVANKVGADDVSVASGSGTLASAAVGTRAISGFGSLALGGTKAGNYTLAGASGSVTIGTAALTITANGDSKTYGQTRSYGSGSTAFTSLGLQNGETIGSVTITASGGTAAGDAVGGYTLTPSAATGGTFTPGNYAITYQAGTLIVNAKALNITANNRVKTYGQAVTFAGTEFTVGAGELVGGDSVTSVTLTSTGAAAGATVTTPGPTYAIAAGAAVGTGLGNYAITYHDGTLTVAPAVLVVTADNKSRLYGEANPSFTATITGFVNGEVLGTSGVTGQPGLSTTATPASSVAGSPYAITAALGTLTAGNYTFTFMDGTLTILMGTTSGLVSSSANPSLPGQQVNFTFTVSAVAPAAGTPTGSALFRFDGQAGTPVALSGGSASLPATLALGTHSLVVEYVGDGNFVGTTNSLAPIQLVNTPPVAATDTIERLPANGVKVSISMLLSNDSDADGDSVSLVSVGPGSVNGGTVTAAGGWVYYTPLPGFTGADSFAYTITDGRGAPVVGQVNVAISNDPGPSPNLTITDLGNGSFRIRFNGIPNRVYRMEYAESLTPTVWVSLGSAMADPAGLFEYVDTPPGGTPQRFYRSVWP